MELEEAIEAALVEVGLGAEYAPDVRAYLEAQDASWRSCCGGLCDPCMLVLGRAVDRARSLVAAGGGESVRTSPGAG